MYDLDDAQKNYVIVGLLIAVLVLIGGTFYFYQGQSCVTGDELSAEEAKTKAVQFINNNLMGQGQSASIENVTSTDSLYKLGLKVQDQSYESYMTKDGSLFFTQGYDMTQSQDGQDQAQSEEIPQKEKPKVELFVMSFCPYGNQAELTMEPVYEQLGDQVDWNIHYIVSKQGDGFSSLHGQKEVAQDKRELCVLKEDGLGEWFDFATYVNDNCGSEGKCWKEAANEAGLSPNSISSCAEEKGDEYLSEEAKISKEKGASGSPTMFINGVESQTVYQYGKPDAYKKEICSGFKDKATECEEELESQSDSSSSGSCQ